MDNIVIATFGTSRHTITDPLYQYDSGQVLKIQGVTLPNIYEVHFSNVAKNRGITSYSYVEAGNANGVAIPDKLLQTGEPIYAWIYYTGTDSGETEYIIDIPVIKRAQIDNPEPTPEDQDVISQAIAALNNAVQLTAADVISADAATVAAASSEVNALAYASAALVYSESARDSVDLIRGYAEAAVGAKDRSEEILTAVGSLYAETSSLTIQARTFAEIAAASASNIVEYEQRTKQYAVTAASSAQYAKDSANLAFGYAQDANDAKASALSAKDSAWAAASFVNEGVISAQNFAEVASASALNASISEANAKDYATLASNSAAFISSQIDEARNLASIASTSASIAVSKAAEAFGSAIAASESANVASTSAASAYDFAVAASSKADEALISASSAYNYASIASAKVQEIHDLTAIASTLSPEASATVEYSDGVLSFGIPKGETGATGATGAIGATGPQGVGIGFVSKTGTSGNVDTYTVYSDETTPSSLGTFTVNNGPVQSVAGKTGAVVLTASDVGALPSDYTPSVSIINNLVPSNGAITATLSPFPITYDFGEVAELNLTLTATTLYHFAFTCPTNVPTILSMSGISGTTGDATLEAGAYYEVDVWNGIALIAKVEVTSV